MFYGFTDYMRDYELLVYCTADPIKGIAPAHLRFLFKLCVHAEMKSAVSEQVWARSLDDRFIDYEAGKDMDGYVWEVKWQVLYPGGRNLLDSELASHWSRGLGVDFDEVVIETAGHELTLAFSQIDVNVSIRATRCSPCWRTGLQDPLTLSAWGTR